MATFLSRSTWAKFSTFHKMVALFLLKTYSCRIFYFSQIQPDETKGGRISTLNHVKNCAMTLPKLLLLLKDFTPDPEYYHAIKFGGN